MADSGHNRTYRRSESVVFLSTKAAYGGLSNMAPGYPICINGIRIRTSEALYQACRYPHLPKVQRLVIDQISPMTAKMVSKPYRNDSRVDWDSIRIRVMRWCLRVKLAQNYDAFLSLLQTTGDLPIVEESRRDPFWGAEPTGREELSGRNIIGRLLMELRLLAREKPRAEILTVQPIDISDFVLYGQPISAIGVDTLAQSPQSIQSPTVFDITNKPTSFQNEIMQDQARLIERAFPLQQASLDSVHEKNVRHGHISTLHIWPARRPLAASRAALIATLLPDPGTPEARQELCQKIGGKIVTKTEIIKKGGKSVEREKVETEGGILHWKREVENADTLEWFRQEIRKAHGGRIPKVLDPFAGGGAIPLEAMRLGCEATAVDVNPVAWFIERCTLEYPQRLAGQVHPLPDFILRDLGFMFEYLMAKGLTKPQAKAYLRRFGGKDTEELIPGMEGATKDILQADLPWHLKAWARWIQDKLRKQLASRFPTYAEFEPLDAKVAEPYEVRPAQLVPQNANGFDQGDKLNEVFSQEYLSHLGNPRWIAKPTVAYLWARTVVCKQCRAEIPLLKTRWLCKKDAQRVLLIVQPNPDRSGVIFSVEKDVPQAVGNAAAKREHDKRISSGTMSKSGASCPCCATIMTRDDIRVAGSAGAIKATMTAVIVDGYRRKEFRLPTELELQTAHISDDELHQIAEHFPFGWPDHSTPVGSSRKGGGSAFTVSQFGLTTWSSLFTRRQLVVIGSLIKLVRSLRSELIAAKYSPAMAEGIYALMAASVDKQADRLSSLCKWDYGYTKVSNTFTRFALGILWDFCETNPLSDTSGNWLSCSEWVVEVTANTQLSCGLCPAPTVIRESSIQHDRDGLYDAIVTDPPYYDAIPYADLMDFFYIWLRRLLVWPDNDLGFNTAFATELSPKWSHETADGELTDDASRHGGDNDKSKGAYETGMGRAFQACHRSLRPEGRLIIVFAHKDPNAWEALTSAMIRAGFVVDGSWPIQTEMANRSRGHGAAALSSSVWLVCKKRPATARPGWDNVVIDEMRTNIKGRLREYWDAGIRGPDFVWAATGPALEAYSKHPVVKKADAANQQLLVTEFLTQVRRIVVDYVVGRVLSGGGEQNDQAAQESMDAPTAYYLLHRNDFGMDPAPSGACILYAVSCGLSDRELDATWDLVSHSGSPASLADEESPEDEQDGSPEEDEDPGKGSTISLKSWKDRKRSSLGVEAPQQKPVPLIDRIHKLMHLWRLGEVKEVDDYLDVHGLRRQELFKRLLQALIELSEIRSEERSFLEALSNHLGSKGAVAIQPATGTQQTLN